MKIINSTPLGDGLKMPFEGDKHYGTLMLLPFRPDIWRNGGVEAREVFKEIVKAISRFEKVYLGIEHSLYNAVASEFTIPNVELIKLPYNDAWARDIMPIFVKDQNCIRGVDFRFNAWGGNYDGLYDDYQDDDQVAGRIAQILGIDYYYLSDFILEGGSIHTDGEGTLLVTEACLLSKGRNIHKSKLEIEETLKQYLGVEKVIWLPRGIYLDETNEHIDNIVCYISPGHVAIAWTDNEDDPQYELSKMSYEVLLNSTDARGRKFVISKLPLPEPALYMNEEEAKGLNDSLAGAKERLPGSRLSASYVNFYQGKEYVILPGFGVREDQDAYRIIKSLFPQKEVIQIQSREILLAGGNIHCITMQIPEKEENHD